MTKSNYEMVKEWTDIFCPDQINNPTEKNKLLRLHLLQEELSELTLALAHEDRVKQLDALVDLEWVLLGSYLLLGAKYNYFQPSVEDVELFHCLYKVQTYLAEFIFSGIDCSLIYGPKDIAENIYKMWFYTKQISYKIGFSKETIQEAFKRVYASNMSKRDDDGKPVRDAAGRILKGPNYVSPNLEDLV